MSKTLFDIHCHILPGVDDGAPTMEDALSMLQKEMDDGVKNVILTPHFFSYGKNSAHINDRFSELSEEAKRKFPELKLYLGQELFFSSSLPELLEEGKALFMGASRYALVEFAPDTEYAILYRGLTELLQSGIQPILAHAERIKALSLPVARELVHVGVYLQINAGSILGKGGFWTRRLVNKLLREELVHFVGSDAHNMTERAPNIKDAYLYTKRKFGRKTAEAIFSVHPQLMLQDKYL